MGKLWEDMSKEELVLSYNGILWGLKEECHCRVRNFDGVNYVIPQVCTVEHFNHHIKPGMLEAKESIENILGQEIEVIEFEMMTGEALDIRQLGWEAYKQVVRIGLEFAGRGSK